MTFIVTGFSVSGPALIGCDSGVEALDEAVELIRAGFAHVRMSDGQGVQYTPCDFARMIRL